MDKKINNKHKHRIVMKKITFLLTVTLILNSHSNYGQSLPNREVNCSEVFKELTDKLESNYLAYKKLVEADKEDVYINRKRNYNRLINKRLSANNCTRMLQLFLKEFNDGHLFVFEKPEYIGREKRILQKRAKRNQRNIVEVLKELKVQGDGEITGKWSDGNYKIAIIKEEDFYNGYTITESDTIQAGILLASFKKGNMDDMHGIWYNYNLEPKFIEANLSKENTLISFSGENKWGRIEGKPKREIEVINPKNITQPSLRFLDEETTLFTIPSFSSDPNYLEELLTRNAKSVLSRSKLIIDVRGNRGGNAVYFGFMPLYATQGFSSNDSGEVLASKEILSYFEQLAKKSPSIYQPVVDRIKNNMGKIVLGPDYPDRPLNSYPSKVEHVAILTDGACMSACESFILHSKKVSNKVRVYGANTAGVIDYTSVMSVRLKSSGNQNIYFGFPTSSLSKEYAIDYPNGYNKTGIRPDVAIPSSVEDKILYVNERMDK
jgi:hypothetical protein